jgi:hypothetical protein
MLSSLTIGVGYTEVVNYKTKHDTVGGMLEETWDSDILDVPTGSEVGCEFCFGQ